jgi:ubiquinone/menaquinone biosynthesis C-methylase UbiE
MSEGKRTIWEILKRRIKKMLRMPLPPKPYERVFEREAELFGLHRGDNGEFFPDFHITSSDTVVDVGCGFGGACVFAAAQGAEVVGVDINPPWIEHTKKRLREETSSQRWKLYVSDSNPLPLESGIATKVICQEVLEHVDDPAAVLAELARIGRVGARYLLSVPDPASEAVMREITPAWVWAKPHHQHIFEHKFLDQLVESVGLTIERRASYSFYWSMWWILLWSEPSITMTTQFGGALKPVLRYWNKTWDALLAAPEGMRVKNALDKAMPKSQFLLARKAA